MIPKKRLQVFVSSTYTDLREERQAAVEAILTAGHIPAGMELFAAGDQSQMEVIRHWIDESDVYMLLLGGRYGSIEPTTGKSYTHLEYEYAVSKGKPFFAVVIEENHLNERTTQYGMSVLELENPHKLKEFRAEVMRRVVRPWGDKKDIKLAVLETLLDYSRRDDLRGWIPGDQGVGSALIAEQLAQLTRENTELRQRILSTADERPAVTYGGLSFADMNTLLRTDTILPSLGGKSAEDALVRFLEQASAELGDRETRLIHVLWAFRDELIDPSGAGAKWGSYGEQLFGKVAAYGLLTADRMSGGYTYYTVTDEGRRFLMRLMLTYKPGTSGHE